MAITFACPGCGGRLRVSDEAAGKKVACPACKGVHVAPHPADAPQPAVVVAEPPPAPPAGSAANPWSFDDPAGGAGEPAPLVRTSSRSSGERRDPERAPRDDDRAAGRGAWAAFGGGCKLAALGTWVEFAAVASVLVPAMVVAVSASAGSTWWASPLSKAGPFVLLPFFALMLAGSVMVAVGRARMMSIPPKSGAGGVLGGALVLSVVRVLALVAGVVFVVLAGLAFQTPGRGATGTTYLLSALGGYGVALFAGVVADVTILPGLAVVGGVIPSAPLRRRAGTAAFLFQLVALVSVLQAAGGYFLLASVMNTTPAGVPRRPDAIPAPRANTTDADRAAGPTAGIVSFGGLMFALCCQAGYASLYAGLYAVGRKAAAAPVE